MKNLEKIKFRIGLTLLLFTLIGLVLFYLESFIGEDFLSVRTSKIWRRGAEGGASNTPIFFGLCGIAGAILLASVKKEE